MKQTKRILSLILAVVMVIGLVLATTSCTALDSSKALFEKALGRTFDEIEGFSYFKTLTNIINQGSIELAVESTDEKMPVSGSVKLYSNAEKQKAALKLAVTADDEKIEAFAFASDSAVMVQCDEILGEPYGLNLKKFEENFKKSIFNPDSDSEYALDEELYDAIIDSIDLYKREKEAIKETRKVLEKFEKEFYKAIEANAELKKETEKIDILEYEEVKATLLTISIDEEGLAKVLETVWKKMKSDKDFKNWIQDYIIDNSAFDSVIGDKYETVGDVIEDIDESVDDVVGDFEDSNLNISASLYLNKSSGAVMRADVSIKEDGDKRSVSVEFGNKFKTFEGFKVTIKNGDNTSKLYLKVVEDTKDEIKVKLEQNFTDDIPEITIKYDRNDGGLTITAEQESFLITNTTILKLNYTKKSGTHTLKFVSISVNGVKTDIPVDITLIVNEKDSMPSADKFIELLSLEDGAMKELINKVSENIKNLKIFEIIEDLF